MYKDTKWAKQIIAAQRGDGGWGNFHTHSLPSQAPMTTEQALRRLERLGYTIGDSCIQKAVAYMADCLVGKKELPDRREKVHNWDIFTSLMLAAWIRRFTPDIPAANRVASQWAAVVSHAFQNGRYCQEQYHFAYFEAFGEKPSGGRLLDFVNFYVVSLLRNQLSEKREAALIEYILEKPDGIYYIYEASLSLLPPVFESRQASRYLAAMELLAGYRHAVQRLSFVTAWLKENRNENGKWDMGKTVKDNLYFPLSESWRKKETREADCTERILNLLFALSGSL